MIYKLVIAICSLVLVSTPLHAQTSETNTIKTTPIILIETTKGDIIIELFIDKAPLTCKNFLQYIEDKYYEQTIFHRVIEGFVIQGGGFDGNYVPKLTRKPIKNESHLTPSNTKGTIAMALTSDKNSATAQFFINLANNSFLDFNPKKRASSFTVFGEVIKGYDTLDKIQKVKTKKITIFSKIYKRDIPLSDVPESPIYIRRIRILRQDETINLQKKETKEVKAKKINV